MAQDATYITKTYHERGGDRYVAGSDGEFAVESGGFLSVVSGGILAFGGQEIVGQDMRKIVSEMGGTVVISPNAGGAAGSTTLSVVNLPANIRTVILSGYSGMISGSFWLTSVSAGREVILIFGGQSASTASAHVLVSCSGCALIGSIGQSISTFGAYWSNSYAMVSLRAVEDNVWAIISQKGDINEAI